MSDVNAAINIQVTNAETATAALNSVSTSMETIGKSSDGLKGKFQERFQHIGLMLFAGDALRASGLGRETREVVSALNLALSSVGQAAGISSGGILLVVSALATLAGLVVTAIEHQKAHIELLGKEIDANNKLSKSYDEGIAAVGVYSAAFGKTNRFIEEYRTAQEKAKRATDDLSASMHLQVIQELNAQIVKQQEAIRSNEELTRSIENHDPALKKIIPDMKVWETGLVSLKRQHQEMQTQLDQTNAKLKTEEGAVVALHHGYQNLNDMLKQTAKARTDEIQAEDKGFKATQEHIAKEIEGAKKIEEQWKKRAEVVKHVTDQIADSFGQAYAKMIVEGASFTETFRQAFKSLAESIITDIIRMETEWMVFSAMSGMGGNVGMMGSMGLKGLGFATGGSLVVDQPTVFMAGEGGPEHVQFTPLTGGSSSQSDSSGSGSVINVGSVTTHVHGVTDPKAIADQVGQQIVRTIRGMGQIGFVRNA